MGGAAHSPAHAKLRRITSDRRGNSRLDMMQDSAILIRELSALSPVEGDETRFHLIGNRPLPPIETKVSQCKIQFTLRNAIHESEREKLLCCGTRLQPTLSIRES